ncbi:MAG TPA: hypothetical protein VGB41_02735 [Acidimicrobiia bacterium]
MIRSMLIVLAALTLVAACGGSSVVTTTSMVAITTTAAPATSTDAPAPSTTTTGSDAVIDPGDGGDYTFPLTASDFVATIDNPYLPLIPGSSWVYEGDGEHIEVSVLTETRVVMGITATVVRDTVTEDGEVTEDTYDWYAQDTAGNVWYLGEDTTMFENGAAVSHEGSWEAGVDGALPGIAMEAAPAPGDSYRQEFWPGHAEDLAQVVGFGGTATTPSGDYTDLLITIEWTPLSPDEIEQKYYALGVGQVYEKVIRGNAAESLLTEFTPGG